MANKKADTTHRYTAKAIDFVIMLLFVSWIPQPVGALAGTLFILIADGFWQGQSVGKKIVGLAIRRTEGGTSMAFFKESIIRNLAFGALLLLSCIPLIGWLFFIVFLAAVGLEAYFVYADEKGIRVGDIFAGTEVIDLGSGETK